MLIYCVGKGGTEAVTIGTLLWLPADKSFGELNKEEILNICRPRVNANKVAQFNSYVDEMSKHGEITIVTENKLPEGCKRRRGFWENNGWK